jgi:hypothetical protein
LALLRLGTDTGNYSGRAMKQIAPDGTADLINRERNEILATRGIMVSH